MHGDLCGGEAHDAGGGPARRLGEEEDGAEVCGEDGLPALHPEIQRGEHDRRGQQTRRAECAVAHIGKEKERCDHARDAADEVAEERGDGRATQQPHGFLQEVDGRLARALDGGLATHRRRRL